MTKNYYSLEVTTTQKCNMRCTYCFEGEELDNEQQALPVETIIENVKELLESQAFLDKHNGITINFWGGEPTLNYSYCQDIIKAFAGAPVDFFFYTNGLLIMNILKILSIVTRYNIDRSRIRFQISYDGLWNDETRITANKAGTSKLVLETFDKLYTLYPDINVSFKSTMPVEKLANDSHSVVDNWKHFRDLNQKYKGRILYSPTLEYTNFYKLSDKQMENIKHQLTKITRLELDFFETNKRHVMSWYTVRDKQLCSAGMNIGNIDLEGNVSVCHGALYSDKKREHVFGSIKPTNSLRPKLSHILLDMKSVHFDILQEQSKVENECTNCSATVCYQCPTVNNSHSKELYYDKRFHDPKKDLCKIYQFFGDLSNTLFKYLNTKKD